jgi:hypothetical protein
LCFGGFIKQRLIGLTIGFTLLYGNGFAITAASDNGFRIANSECVKNATGEFVCKYKCIYHRELNEIKTLKCLTPDRSNDQEKQWSSLEAILLNLRDEKLIQEAKAIVEKSENIRGLFDRLYPFRKEACMGIEKNAQLNKADIQEQIERNSNSRKQLDCRLDTSNSRSNLQGMDAETNGFRVSPHKCKKDIKGVEICRQRCVISYSPVNTETVKCFAVEAGGEAAESKRWQPANSILTNIHNVSEIEDVKKKIQNTENLMIMTKVLKEHFRLAACRVILGKSPKLNKTLEENKNIFNGYTKLLSCAAFDPNAIAPTPDLSDQF